MQGHMGIINCSRYLDLVKNEGSRAVVHDAYKGVFSHDTELLTICWAILQFIVANT